MSVSLFGGTLINKKFVMRVGQSSFTGSLFWGWGHGLLLDMRCWRLAVDPSIQLLDWVFRFGGTLISKKSVKG